MGVPWADAPTIGGLLGIKTVLNEFVSYLELSALLTGGADLDPRSVIIATYALSGFANFSSIAVQIGGIGGIAPSRRSDLSRLGLRAMVAGSLAAFMTATIAGMLL
jgi:CNT family concentrative nucleoside transporter